MADPDNNNLVDEDNFYLLMGEKQGVAADEWVELTEAYEGPVIQAQFAEELADERATSLPGKLASENN